MIEKEEDRSLESGIRKADGIEISRIDRSWKKWQGRSDENER